MSFRFALNSYILNPEKHKESVVFEDDNFVIIKDAFPKSVIHYLVLPRSPKWTSLHPLKALKDDELLALCLEYVEIALAKLEAVFNSKYRHIGSEPFSVRDDFVQIGVHSVPSLNNLHIHVMTKDLCSARMKNKKHYNSFKTRFFVPLEDISLMDKDDPRMSPRQMEDTIKNSDLICHYCGENFKNKFALLKKHIDHEFSKSFKKLGV
ncbi:unnamed protein product [Kuraishia capsulata CBS 1993]|uniref:Aprataxin C2HE/C2H2/C2HC zinc finger domain-containing protein n=1 Tax=Kuraishia capsulata CBS 1993 TaxID=1382522 RepID=W6MLA3_9ASCO|nr:uncharacterized protein KUCA_T00001532001 [Kuraishia capsulata CBS 1993]CDK25562.1 unnamed protein product [Kuraishia capsulata CBS 1993]